MDTEAKFSKLLTTLMEEHKDVITMLAEGFSETKKHIQVTSWCWLSIIEHHNV